MTKQMNYDQYISLNGQCVGQGWLTSLWSSTEGKLGIVGCALNAGASAADSRTMVMNTVLSLAVLMGMTKIFQYCSDKKYSSEFGADHHYLAINKAPDKTARTSFAHLHSSGNLRNIGWYGSGITALHVAVGDSTTGNYAFAPVLQSLSSGHAALTPTTCFINIAATMLLGHFAGSAYRFSMVKNGKWEITNLPHAAEQSRNEVSCPV